MFDTPQTQKERKKLDERLTYMMKLFSFEGDMTTMEDSCMYNCCICEFLTYAVVLVMSKRYRKSLQTVATSKQLAVVRAQLDSLINNKEIPPLYEDDIIVGLPQLGEEPAAEYSTKSNLQLWKEMDIGDICRVPGMAEEWHKTKKFSRWDNDEEARQFWLSDGNSEFKEQLELQWHQTVGVHQGSTLMLKRQPFFLFDAVGMGKTIQGTALLLMRPYLMEYHEKHGHYPPAWSMCIQSKLMHTLTYFSQKILRRRSRMALASLYVRQRLSPSGRLS
jgi:hypothetical protein